MGLPTCAISLPGSWGAAVGGMQDSQRERGSPGHKNCVCAWCRTAPPHARPAGVPNKGRGPHNGVRPDVM